MAKDVKPVEEIIQVDEKAKAEAEAKAKAEAEALEKKAIALMTGHNVSVIWYCSERDYWFTKKDSADQYAKSNGVTLKKFEK